MDTAELKARFKHITVWKNGGQRAPHKPLLILMALSRCIGNHKRLIPYSTIDRSLKNLLVEFGPARRSYHPEYPFWRLQNDGIWEVTDAGHLKRRKNQTDIPRKALLDADAHGGFTRIVQDHLKKNPELAAEIASSVLENHFPASIHEDILQAVGLDLDADRPGQKKRDPRFRDRILNAYEYRCAVCGFNVRVGNILVALEAAHIKWHQAGGPDREENGVALCALHHKLFDRGAFTISPEHKIIVSDRAHGTAGFNEWLMAYHGKNLTPPQRPSFYPEPDFTAWHVREVFQGEGRYWAGPAG